MQLALAERLIEKIIDQITEMLISKKKSAINNRQSYEDRSGNERWGGFVSGGGDTQRARP